MKNINNKRYDIKIEKLPYDEKLDYILKNFNQLKAVQPSFLANLLVSIAVTLSKKGMRPNFIKRWMEKANEIDPLNHQSFIYLSRIRLIEKQNLLEKIEFPPLRELDTKTQQELTIEKYKETCNVFLQQSNNELAAFKEEISNLEKLNEKELLNLYHQYFDIYVKLCDEIESLLSIINDFDETTKRALYTKTQFQQIQDIVNRIKQLKKDWKDITIDINTEKGPTALEELNQMIGLSDVKNVLSNFMNTLSIKKAVKKPDLKLSMK